MISLNNKKRVTKFKEKVYKIVQKIPCHRVIRSDGKIGGYNKGAENKITLLSKEGVVIRNRTKSTLSKEKVRIWQV